MICKCCSLFLCFSYCFFPIVCIPIEPMVAPFSSSYICSLFLVCFCFHKLFPHQCNKSLFSSYCWVEFCVSFCNSFFPYCFFLICFSLLICPYWSTLYFHLSFWNLYAKIDFVLVCQDRCFLFHLSFFFFLISLFLIDLCHYLIFLIDF